MTTFDARHAIHEILATTCADALTGAETAEDLASLVETAIEEFSGEGDPEREIDGHVIESVCREYVARRRPDGR